MYITWKQLFLLKNKSNYKHYVHYSYHCAPSLLPKQERDSSWDMRKVTKRRRWRDRDRIFLTTRLTNLRGWDYEHNYISGGPAKCLVPCERAAPTSLSLSSPPSSRKTWYVTSSYCLQEHFGEEQRGNEHRGWQSQKTFLDTSISPG